MDAPLILLGVMKKFFSLILNYIRKEWFLIAMIIAITVIIMLFEIF
jgi:hypothetical protein